MKTLLFNLRRVSLDLCILLSLLGAIVLLPPPETGIIILYISKLLFVSSGIALAHVTRKLYWPYINFSSEPDPLRKAMVIAWYIIIIYAVSHGG